MPSTPVLGLPYPANTDLVNQGYDAIGDLAQAVEDVLVDENWHAVGDSGEPAFATGASNSGSGYQPLEFRKVGNAVELRGVVSTASASNDLFTLPAGYRPASAQNLPASHQFGDSIFVQVLNTGVVSLHNFSGASTTFAGFSSTIWVD